MERRSNKIIYETHSWAGVLFSIALFIISFSGIVSLFDKELTQWERPSHRIAYDKSQVINIDRLVKPVLATANLRQDRPILITLPNEYRPTLAVIWVDAENDKVIKEYINPVNENVIHRQGNDFTELLRRMHTDLLLPHPFGRYFIGFMGLVMMLSILSGIIIHKKIFSEMFKFRINRSKRLLWTDFHKVIGVWPLPFHIMISFSGAMLGLAGLMINVAAFSAFDGDVDAAVATVLGERVEMSGEPLPDYSLDLLVEKYRTDRPRSTPTMLMIEGYGDLNQVIQVSGEKEGALVAFSNIKYRSHNHEILHVNTADDATPFMLAYYALTPLHYALYGGFLVKALYFILGLSLCLMMVSGTVIWQIRQTQRSKSGLFLSLLTVGICSGMVVATATLFYANKLLPMGNTLDERYDWIFIVYFAVWLVCLIWTFIRQKAKQAAVELLQISGVLLLGIPAVNMFTTGKGLLSFDLTIPLPLLLVDVLLVLLGFTVLYATGKMKY